MDLAELLDNPARAAAAAARAAEREWQRQRFDELVTARLEPQERER